MRGVQVYLWLNTHKVACMCSVTMITVRLLKFKIKNDCVLCKIFAQMQGFVCPCVYFGLSVCLGQRH